MVVVEVAARVAAMIEIAVVGVVGVGVQYLFYIESGMMVVLVVVEKGYFVVMNCIVMIVISVVVAVAVAVNFVALVKRLLVVLDLGSVTVDIFFSGGS